MKKLQRPNGKLHALDCTWVNGANQAPDFRAGYREVKDNGQAPHATCCKS